MSIEIRRATAADLPELKKLWWRENFDASAVAARMSEFQVVVDDGKIVAALGLQIVNRQGKLHSELIVDPTRADELRSLLWRRMETWAKNFGVFRLWTSLSAPFWEKNGFEIAKPELRVPPEFAEKEKPLRVLQLGPEPPEHAVALAEFGLMEEAARGQRKRFLARVEVIAVIIPTLFIVGIKLWHVHHLSTLRVRLPKPGSVYGKPFESRKGQNTNAVPENPVRIETNSPFDRRI